MKSTMEIEFKYKGNKFWALVEPGVSFDSCSPNNDRFGYARTFKIYDDQDKEVNLARIDSQHRYEIKEILDEKVHYELYENPERG